MNRFSFSRHAAVFAFTAVLTACSSTLPEDKPSTQVAPGTQSRPILTSGEAQNFVAERYFASMNPNEAPWTPVAIRLPQQPDFIVGPADNTEVTHHSIQAAVDAAVSKHSSQRQYIAILPGEYEGTLYIPAASSSITLYGTTSNPADVKIGLSLDSEMDPVTWRKTVNPSGKYMPGKPAWYMFDNCQNHKGATVGIMCSAAVWSQNSGLQLQNLTVQNTLGDSVDAGNHQAVALRSDGDKVQLNNIHILGRQNTFFVTNSDVQNRLLNDKQPRTLVTNSYIEGDVDVVAGRGSVVFENTDFRLVSSRTQEGAVFAPATLPNLYFGFLAINSHFSGNGNALLGRSWDIETAGQRANGQVVIRDSVISEGFNQAHPWGDALGSQRPYSGNIGAKDDQGQFQRDLNASDANRLWEYNNRGTGSTVINE
ncbi:putative acyl-CoA thioester hydrolase [Citrobacter sp. JGM124]|uniref:putative acyl-CoA thioester hydrolase n=1 Tax=Citrobacter sp. JGM124 TaxID=2799789 RepID=UPI001BA4516E|nr:putative acyl-CoA thioester hydrolase [Citrobacter sp. JGM124]MBS0847694.1 putative acyl-CoA thioester hydrolase [Citrobacter sp. JGM124]